MNLIIAVLLHSAKIGGKREQFANLMTLLICLVQTRRSKHEYDRLAEKNYCASWTLNLPPSLRFTLARSLRSAAYYGFRSGILKLFIPTDLPSLNLKRLTSSEELPSPW